jgi:hypothetical protein
MISRRIVRERGACDKLGCGRTKLREDYRLTDPASPFVPDTEIRRLKPVPLGPRNIGYLEHEIDALIDALATLRDVPAGNDCEKSQAPAPRAGGAEIEPPPRAKPPRLLPASEAKPPIRPGEVA